MVERDYSLPAGLMNELFVLCSGSLKRVLGVLDYYKPRYFQSVSPELFTGIPESDDDNAPAVARSKNLVVKEKLETSNINSQHSNFYSVDVVVRIWKGDESDQESAKYFHNLRRELTGNEEGNRRVIERAREEALQVYCNGQFYVIWNVGMSLMSDDGQIDNLAELRVFAEFDQLDEATVNSAFVDRSALDMSSRVDLSEMARNNATNIEVSNARNETLSFENHSDVSNFIHLLIANGVVPSTFISQLAEVIPESPHEVLFAW